MGRIHLSSNPCELWVTTCPGCTRSATAMKAIARVGMATVVAPSAAAAAGTAATIAAGAYTGCVCTSIFAPLLACGPVALLYEPVRRYSGRKRNRFAEAALVGARFWKKKVRKAFRFSDVTHIGAEPPNF